MKILRRYQLDIIGLFFALIVLVAVLLYGLERAGLDPHRYEWYVAGPVIIFYVAYLWRIRGTINIRDRRTLTTRSLIYWIALGIVLFGSYATPLPAADYWSLHALYVCFTLLLADSYWDFRKLTLKAFFTKRDSA